MEKKVLTKFLLESKQYKATMVLHSSSLKDIRVVLKLDNEIRFVNNGVQVNLSDEP